MAWTHWAKGADLTLEGWILKAWAGIWVLGLMGPSVMHPCGSKHGLLSVYSWEYYSRMSFWYTHWQHVMLHTTAGIKRSKGVFTSVRLGRIIHLFAADKLKKGNAPQPWAQQQLDTLGKYQSGLLIFCNIPDDDLNSLFSYLAIWTLGFCVHAFVR